MPEYMPYMQMMGLTNQYYPMMEMPEEQLESMYPKVYDIVYHQVKQQCDMHDSKYGMMHNPTREQLDTMVNDINNKVEGNVEAEISKDEKERQFGFGGRSILRDLVTILLLRELLERRRRPHHFGGYGGGYGGYPGGGYGGYGGY